MNDWVTVWEIFCSLWLQEASSIPVSRISSVPEGVGAKNGQLAAVLDHAGHLCHLEPVAQLCEDTPVSCIHNSSCSDLKGDIETLEPVALDGGGQLVVPLGLSCHCRRHVGRRVPGNSQLDQLNLLGHSVHNNKVRLLSCHRYVGGDGDAVDPVYICDIIIKYKVFFLTHPKKLKYGKHRLG